VLGAVAGRLLFGDVSAPALQARFAGGGEQFVFVQDAARAPSPKRSVEPSSSPFS